MLSSILLLLQQQQLLLLSWTNNSKNSSTIDDDYWNVYVNGEDSFMIPYFVPFCFWLSCYIYCIVISKSISSSSSSSSSSTESSEPVLSFHKWYTIHNIHNFGAIILGTISIYSDSIVTTQSTSSSSSVFNERIPILWSLSYFTIDMIDCMVRYDIVYLFHAVCCFVLGYCNYSTPILRQLHMNSKASYCELSNPFMHLVKRTRQPIHFVLFTFVFTCCRIIWIPIMYYQLITYIDPITTVTLPWYHPICCILLAFYILNLYWYYKMIRILMSGGNSDKSKKE